MQKMPIPPGGYKPPSGRVTANHAGPSDRKDPQTGQFRAKGGKIAPSTPRKATGSAALHGRPSAVEKGPAKGPSGGKKK